MIGKPQKIQRKRLSSIIWRIDSNGIPTASPKRLKPPKRAKIARTAKKYKRTKKSAPPSISKLIKACDAAFSIQVRMKGAWHDGKEFFNKDYTSGFIYPVKKLHCGHYLSRYYKAARWDFDNARPQSFMSNIGKRGDPIAFRQNLVKEIGVERVEAVEKKRHQTIKLTRQFLEDKLQELLKSVPTK